MVIDFKRHLIRFKKPDIDYSHIEDQGFKKKNEIPFSKVLKFETLELDFNKGE